MCSTCSNPPDGVCTGLQSQVTRQGGDGRHEAHDEGVGLDHLVQLVNDNAAHELQGHGQEEGGHSLDRQAPGADWVQQTVLNIRLRVILSYGPDLVLDLGLLLRQVAELVHLPPELGNGGRTLQTLAGLCGGHNCGHGESRAWPRARARQTLDKTFINRMEKYRLNLSCFTLSFLFLASIIFWPPIKNNRTVLHPFKF